MREALSLASCHLNLRLRDDADSEQFSLCYMHFERNRTCINDSRLCTVSAHADFMMLQQHAGADALCGVCYMYDTTRHSHQGVV